MNCPGQDTRYWRPGDIFEVPCCTCGKPVEFFKDESRRKCPHCGYRMKNPKLDLGCAEHCPYGPQCIGAMEEKRPPG